MSLQLVKAGPACFSAFWKTALSGLTPPPRRGTRPYRVTIDLAGHSLWRTFGLPGHTGSDLPPTLVQFAVEGLTLAGQLWPALKRVIRRPDLSLALRVLLINPLGEQAREIRSSQLASRSEPEQQRSATMDGYRSLYVLWHLWRRYGRDGMGPKMCFDIRLVRSMPYSIYRVRDHALVVLYPFDLLANAAPALRLRGASPIIRWVAVPFESASGVEDTEGMRSGDTEVSRQPAPDLDLFRTSLDDYIKAHTLSDDGTFTTGRHLRIDFSALQFARPSSRRDVVLTRPPEEGDDAFGLSRLDPFFADREVRLSRYRVIGEYFHADPRIQFKLGEHVQKIETIASDPAQWSTPNNTLIGGRPGNGKTGYVDALSEHLKTLPTLQGRMEYRKHKLSGTDKSKLRTFVKDVDALLSAHKFVVALIDEVDGLEGEPWPYDEIYQAFEWCHRGIVWFCVGSSGRSMSDLEERIRPRNKGGDLLRRCGQFKLWIPEMTALDKFVVACSKIRLLGAPQNDSPQVEWAEASALLWLSSLRDGGEITNSVTHAVTRARAENPLYRRLVYDDFFDGGDGNRIKFRDDHPRWRDTWERRVFIRD